MLRKLFAFFIFLTLCFPISLAYASTTSEGCPAQSTTTTTSISTAVQISALYPNPNTGEQEWIELTNTGSSSLDLNNYTLEDATAKPWTASGTVTAGGKLQLTGFNFQLNNSNETVTLKTNAGTLVDTWTYATSSKGVILYRTSQSTTTETPSATTTTNTSSTSTTQSTPSLWPAFSEALPNPEGTDSTEEWIELYNPYSEVLTLTGLQLDDAEDGSSPYSLTGTLAADSTLLISIEDSHLNLNNTEDHVRLLGVNGEILWDYSYSNPKEGSSLIAYGNSTTWTTHPTPGEDNIAVESETPESSQKSTSNETSSSETYQNGDLSESVEITEVFPNPEGPDNEEEWIELTNGGTEAVNLGNWTLTDASGKTYTFPDSTVIQAGETVVLYRTESTISLNNSNESLTLADFTDEVLSEVSFETSEEDQSYSEIQIEEVSSVQASVSGLGNPVLTLWQWVTPSPGLQNPIWKQIKGSVTEFDGSLLTLFDGISTWTFKTSESSTDELLYQTGNILLIQASLKNDLYEIMHAELLENSGKSQNSASFPWSIALSLTGLTGWGVYELYKRRKTILNFGALALK